MSFPRRTPNTKINEVRVNINSEYAEELQLNIRCDENDNHIAVLYCPKCETNLCRICSDRIHSIKALSKHEAVRLTQKPEPPIYCYSHPQKTAELVCKEPKCELINKPMCTMCHQYKTHKDHKYEILEDEYDKIRIKISNCLKEVESKRMTCDKNVDEYDKCISTYSSNNAGFWKNERDKIDKFYSDARTLALKTFDDFANNRISTLKLLKNQYINDRTKLEVMSSELRNIEEMKKVEVIKSGNNVEKMIIQAGRNIDKPTDLIPSKNCDIKYPDIALMNLKIDISRNVQSQNQQKTAAVCFSYDYDFFSPSEVLGSRETLTVEDKNNGKLYKYKDGPSILNLNELPNNNTIDLSQYKYIYVIDCWSGYEEDVKNRLNEQMKNNWWSRIVVWIDAYNWESNKDFVNRIQEIVKKDKRVEVMKYKNVKEILDNILEV